MKSVGVIGAGPAGSLWARKLSETGKFDVFLYDKQDFSSSSDTRRYLRAVNGRSAAEFIEKNGLEYDRKIVKGYLGSKLGVTVRADAREFGYDCFGYIVSGSGLKKKLAMNAVKAGADLIDGVEVTSLVKMRPAEKVLVSYENKNEHMENHHDLVIYAGDGFRAFVDRHFDRPDIKKGFVIAEIEVKGKIRGIKNRQTDAIMEARPEMGSGYSAVFFGGGDTISLQCAGPSKNVSIRYALNFLVNREMGRISKKYDVEYTGKPDVIGGISLPHDTAGSLVSDNMIKGGATVAGIQSRISITGIIQSYRLVESTFPAVLGALDSGDLSKSGLSKYQEIVDLQRALYEKHEKVQKTMSRIPLGDIGMMMAKHSKSARKSILDRVSFEETFPGLLR